MIEPAAITSAYWFDDVINYATIGYDDGVTIDGDGGAFVEDFIDDPIPNQFSVAFGCNSTSGRCDVARSVNDTSRSSDRHPNVEDSIRIVMLSFYLAIFVFGLAGNSLIIYVIVRMYRDARGGRRGGTAGRGRRTTGGSSSTGSRSVSNLYILNLAAADELFVLTLPFFCYATYTREWAFGEPACKLTYAVRETNKYASVLTLVALSVDRCMATFHRVVDFRRTPVAVGVCASIWLLCLAGAGVPQIIYGRLVTSADGRRSCRVVWPHLVHLAARRAWIYGQLVLGVVVPFFIIAVVNVVLLQRLKTFASHTTPAAAAAVSRPLRQRQRVQRLQSSSFCDASGGVSANEADEPRSPTPQLPTGKMQKLRQMFACSGGRRPTTAMPPAPPASHCSASTRRERATRNMIRLVMAIVAIFFICQLPYHVIEIVSLQMYEIYGGGVASSSTAPRRPSPAVQRVFVYANAAAQVMVFVSSGCNPIVYGVFNKNYRKLYRQVLCCIRQQKLPAEVTQNRPATARGQPPQLQRTPPRPPSSSYPSAMQYQTALDVHLQPPTCTGATVCSNVQFTTDNGISDADQNVEWTLLHPGGRHSDQARSTDPTERVTGGGQVCGFSTISEVSKSTAAVVTGCVTLGIADGYEV